VAQALLSRWAWVSYMVKGYGDRQVSPLSPFASVFRLYSSTLYYDVGGFKMPTDDPNPGVRPYRQRVGNHNFHAGAAMVSSSTNDKIFELGNHGMLPSL